MGGNISQLVYLTPHPRLWSSGCVQIRKMTFKCYISKNYENTLKFRHFLHVYNNQSLQMPWMTEGCNLSQLVYLTPHPRLWSSDHVQIMQMTFKCYISENDENILLFRHFMLVDNNQSLAMSSMTGGGGGHHIPAGLSHPPPPPPPPPPRLWSSDCVQIMKLLLIATLVKMMKNS